MDQLQNLNTAISYIRKLVHTITYSNFEHRAQNFLLKAHLDIESMITEFGDLCQIINKSKLDKGRAKRFLSLLIALGSLSSVSSTKQRSSILHGEISVVMTRQKHIVDIL
jgi:hypothetical protein